MTQETASQPVLIVVGGPTAVGKTRLSIQLAQHFGCEILSADSRQFYREMNIGTAKPDAEELAAATHHFINSLSIEDSYSVGDFERDGLGKLQDVFSRNDKAVLVGGSGLYIRALCEGLDTFPSVPEDIKKDLEKELQVRGLLSLQRELHEKDPGYYKEVDTENPHRLLRALSVIRTTGIPFSEYRKQNTHPRSFRCIYIALTADREALYLRINARVDRMMEAGLLEEVRELYPRRELKSLQTVGYQEFFPYFEDKRSLEEAVELVKRNSRRYAKRQMTWFRNQQPKNGAWQYFAADALEDIIACVEEGVV